jgi:Fe-S oxidoreductase
MSGPFRTLPVLQSRERELELCTYCPKLCRAACPVSNAEPKETLIPWGKMSTALFLARGDVPLDASHASTAWACTGCMACREKCDHHNEVAPTLFDARAALFEHGVAPAAAVRTSKRFSSHVVRTSKAVARVAAKVRGVGEKGTPVLIGCGYARGLPDVAEHALSAAAKLIDGPVRAVQACCGQPLRAAGDLVGFRAAAARLEAELGDAERVVVVDPGCAATVRSLGSSRSVPLLVELAADALPRLERLTSDVPVRWHDPCSMSRGLGVTDAPRAVLARILGAPPGEFARSRGDGACSGGGGLLPATMPETSRTIARTRVSEHEGEGGGEIVTACASSVLRFRAAGARTSDLAAWIDRALR